MLEKRGIKVRIPAASTLLQEEKPSWHVVDEAGSSFSGRVWRLKKAIQSAPQEICMERALLVDGYYRSAANRCKPSQLQRGEIMKLLLSNKTASVYADELLVGNFTSKRMGANIHVEWMSGLGMFMEGLTVDRRKYNPFKIRLREKLQLVRMMPFWLRHNVLFKFFDRVSEKADMLQQVLKLDEMILTESSGYGHIVPDYETLMKSGTVQTKQRMAQRMAETDEINKKNFFRSIILVCEGLEAFADKYVAAAQSQLRSEVRAERRADLEKIVACCQNVPRRPASTLQEALQFIIFLQIALNIDNMDNGISPGRLDKVLWPYYQSDISRSVLTRAAARELIAAFCLKLFEFVPVVTQDARHAVAGQTNGQIICVGGVDEEGRDITNDLSYVFLDVMRELRLSRPNFYARFHPGSPRAYMRRIAENLRNGCVSPAVANDDVFIPLLQARGNSLQDARDYILVGCVEPVACKKTLGSTDAALINMALCLERALGLKKSKISPACRQVRREARTCQTIEEVWELFAEELAWTVERMFYYQQKIEIGIQKHMPSPIFSLCLEGCLDAGVDATRGGAKYNATGLQAVGCADIADSFAAMEEVVFAKRLCSMEQLIAALRSDFRGFESVCGYLQRAPKYGNNDPRADKWMTRFVKLYRDSIKSRYNLRGGPMLPGYYSMGLHVKYGQSTMALPSGRRAAKPLASGISPCNEGTRLGPTAVLNSVCSIDARLMENGSNFNFTIDNTNLDGDQGIQVVEHLMRAFFKNKGNQLQANIFDPSLLLAAKNNPEAYPWLVVRVSGYTAYFKDLSPDLQQEIIDRYKKKD